MLYHAYKEQYLAVRHPSPANNITNANIGVSRERERPCSPGVGEDDLHARVEVRQLVQSSLQTVELELRRSLENL